MVNINIHTWLYKITSPCHKILLQLFFISFNSSAKYFSNWIPIRQRQDRKLAVFRGLKGVPNRVGEIKEMEFPKFNHNEIVTKI